MRSDWRSQCSMFASIRCSPSSASALTLRSRCRRLPSHACDERLLVAPAARARLKLGCRALAAGQPSDERDERGHGRIDRSMMQGYVHFAGNPLHVGSSAPDLHGAVRIGIRTTLCATFSQAVQDADTM